MSEQQKIDEIQPEQQLKTEQKPEEKKETKSKPLMTEEECERLGITSQEDIEYYGNMSPDTFAKHYYNW